MTIVLLWNRCGAFGDAPSTSAGSRVQDLVFTRNLGLAETIAGVFHGVDLVVLFRTRVDLVLLGGL